MGCDVGYCFIHSKFDGLSLAMHDAKESVEASPNHHMHPVEPSPLVRNSQHVETFSSVLSYQGSSDEGIGDLHLGDDSEDDDNEDTTTDSRSEMTVCAAVMSAANMSSVPQSVDSSTDTLVAGDGSACNGTVKALEGIVSAHELNGGVQPVLNASRVVGSPTIEYPGGDACRVCASSRRFLADNVSRADGSASSSTSGKTSRYSTPPLYCRTPSSGYPTTPCDERVPRHHSSGGSSYRPDDLDGLAPLHNDVQLRLQQIITEHKVSTSAHVTGIALYRVYSTILHLFHDHSFMVLS